MYGEKEQKLTTGLLYMPREEGWCGICYHFSLSITRLVHVEYVSSCAQGIHRIENDVFSKTSFCPYIILSTLSAITKNDAHADPNF